MEIVEKAFKPDLKVEGHLSEFLGLATDSKSNGRRPRGLKTDASGNVAPKKLKL